MLLVNGQSNTVTVQRGVPFTVTITGTSGNIRVDDVNPIPDEQLWNGDVGTSGTFSFQLTINADKTMKLFAYGWCFGDVCLQQSNPVYVTVGGGGDDPPIKQIVNYLKWIPYIIIAVVLFMIYKEYKSVSR